MNVKQIKDLIKDLPDGMILLKSSHDHSYRQTSLILGTAIRDGDDRDFYHEDHGEDRTPEKEFGKRCKRIEAVFVNEYD